MWLIQFFISFQKINYVGRLRFQHFFCTHRHVLVEECDRREAVVAHPDCEVCGEVAASQGEVGGDSSSSSAGDGAVEGGGAAGDVSAEAEEEARLEQPGEVALRKGKEIFKLLQSYPARCKKCVWPFLLSVLRAFRSDTKGGSKKECSTDKYCSVYRYTVRSIRSAIFTCPLHEEYF